MQQTDNKELMNLLDYAMTRPETFVDDFNITLLHRLHYIPVNHVVTARTDLRLHICGQYKHAKTDICIIDRSHNDTIIFVQENKRSRPTVPADAPAQLVAESVAAFNENNEQRRLAGLDPLRKQVSHFIHFLTLFLFFLRSYPALSWLARRHCSLKSP